MNAPHSHALAAHARHVLRTPHTTCPRCAAHTPVLGHVPWARAALYLAWAMFAVMLGGAVLTGLMVVALGPLVGALAAPTLAWIGTLCDAQPACVACGCYLPRPGARA